MDRDCDGFAVGVFAGFRRDDLNDAAIEEDIGPAQAATIAEAKAGVESDEEESFPFATMGRVGQVGRVGR